MSILYSLINCEYLFSIHICFPLELDNRCFYLCFVCIEYPTSRLVILKKYNLLPLYHEIVISIPLINCDFAGTEHYQDNCYFYSINKSDWRQESTMYNHHEKGRALDLESVLQSSWHIKLVLKVIAIKRNSRELSLERTILSKIINGN